MANEYYVIGKDKSSAPAYKKDEVYNKTEINDKINDIDNSLNDKAEQSDVTALQAAVNNKLEKDVIQDYVPKTTTINGKALSGPITLDYNSVGAAQAVHNHDDIYYRKDNINSKIDTINSSIDNVLQSVNSRPIPKYEKVTEAKEREDINNQWTWVARLPHLEVNQIAFVIVDALCGNSSSGFWWDEGDVGAIKTRADEKCVVYDVTYGRILDLAKNAVINYDLDTDNGYIKMQYIVLRTE